MSEEATDLIQDIYDEQGWSLNQDELERKILELPNQDKEHAEQRKNYYTKKIKEIFDNADNRLKSEESNEVQIHKNGYVEVEKFTENPNTILTVRPDDLHLVMELTRDEVLKRGNVDNGPIPGDIANSKRSNVFKVFKEKEEHEMQHFNILKGNILDDSDSPLPDEESIKFGIKISPPSYNNIGGKNYDVDFFVTFKGRVTLRTFIDTAVAPERLSDADIKMLTDLEHDLKNRGIILENESIQEKEDRNAVYQRWEQEGI